MTFLKPALRLNRLVVYKKGMTVYDEKYHIGVNIIRGANGSGKSTIADFIFFILGGDVSDWKQEAGSCDTVMAEVSLNDMIVTLSRVVSKFGRQPMRIFWGDIATAMVSHVQGWQSFPFRRSQDMESYSQVLFRAMGLPEVRVENETNITMHQILRLLFVDQMSPADSLFRYEQFDSTLTRSSVYDLLIGLFDNELYDNELKVRAQRIKLSQAKEKIGFLRDALSDLDQATDITSLEASVRAKQEELQTLSRTIQTHAAQSTRRTEPAKDQSEVLRKEYEASREHLVGLNDELSKLQIEIEDSEKFLEELNKRIIGLSESFAIRNILGALPLQYCPHCLQRLELDAPETSCQVCRQPLPTEQDSSQFLRFQQELTIQIKESTILLDEKKKRLDLLRGQLPTARKVFVSTTRRLKEALSTVTTERNSELDQIHERRGSLEAEVNYLLKFHTASRTYNSLTQSIGQLSSEISQLEQSIALQHAAQRERRSIASVKISANAVRYLHRDLATEERFVAANQVTVELAPNSFAVDGRNQFSASSVTYLKNVVHLAILFASLELDFFRYPRILICDNIEDKGMVAIRSQNLQRMIVEESAKYSVVHQIIFTTSMIDPTLNNTTYCVGDEYSHGNKSLKV